MENLLCSSNSGLCLMIIKFSNTNICFFKKNYSAVPRWRYKKIQTTSVKRTIVVWNMADASQKGETPEGASISTGGKCTWSAHVVR